MTSFLKQITFKDNDTGSLFIIYVFSKQNTNLFFIQDWTGFDWILPPRLDDFRYEYNNGDFISYIETLYNCTLISQVITQDKKVVSRWGKIFHLLISRDYLSIGNP